MSPYLDLPLRSEAMVRAARERRERDPEINRRWMAELRALLLLALVASCARVPEEEKTFWLMSQGSGGNPSVLKRDMRDEAECRREALILNVHYELTEIWYPSMYNYFCARVK